MRVRPLIAASILLLSLIGMPVLALVLAAPASAASAAPAAPTMAVGSWGAGAPAATNPAYDSMTAFTGQFILDKDGGATVTETIDYRFGTSTGTHHGIFRNIVVRQDASDAQKQAAGSDNAYRYYAFDLVSVESPTGASTKAQVTDDGASTQVKIGDAKQTVDGTQTYVLTYHLANVMNPFTDHAEFFYNVFKSDSIPKDTVTLTVNGPGGVTQVRCSKGNTDPGEPCDSATPGSPATFSVTNLLGNQDLTIANELPLAGFGDLQPDIRIGGSVLGAGQAKVVTSLALAGGVVIPLAAAGLMATLVATRGRDEWYAGVTPGLTPGTVPSPGGPPSPAGSPDSAAAPVAQPPVVRGRRPEIAVQFNPPPGVQPGMVGTIIDESADTIDVSATVMDLAVRGYLTIEEVQTDSAFSRTDWRLTALQPPAGDLRPYEETVLAGLFSGSGQVLLSELKYKFATTLRLAVSQMYTEVVQRGWFRKSPQRQRAVWQTLGSLLVGAGLISVFALGVLTFGIDRTAGFGLGVPSGVVLGAGLIVGGIIFFVFGRRMASKTAAGSAVLAQSLGFRQYLVTAEADQIKFEEASAIFSRYLPYAIVFGVADRWAGMFQKVAEAAAAAGQPLLMPTWYIYNGAMFPNFTGIADGAGSFATSAGGTFAATASSGSSGGSGFSGGGFSGGGIGGSSSGSW
ncbi:DUF2207 domain-containing protein [Lapillicoccus sp.]|uniref:DUF2207 domain-containing protein n=1 Tax=Lapillicoccus sp. TaxID=1909287 RepID=UPI00326365E3